MTDPLTAIDNLVRDALTQLEGLTALVRVSKIQLWDRAVDIRGEVETATDMGGRCWVVPVPSELDLNWSSDSVKHVRKYAVGFGVGNLKLEECRKIERQVQRAMARLNKGLKADAVTPISHPLPLTIESVAAPKTDPDREPLHDPQEWTDVCDVAVVAFEPYASLMS